MKMTLSKLNNLKKQQEKIVCVTAYDASFAYWVNQANIEVILVGDSLGMVVQGEENTLPVTVQDMVYHTRMVRKGVLNQFSDKGDWQAWIIADLPFMSDMTLESCLENSKQLMKHGHANMVKLEGGARVIPMVKALSELGVPVCGHLGLLPQSVQSSGYRMAAQTDAAAEKLMQEAIALEGAGAKMLVLECVPTALSKKVTDTLQIPVIGIGSGPATDGQVLVMYDLLGLTPGKLPSFTKNFLQETHSIEDALVRYRQAVKLKQFPN